MHIYTSSIYTYILVVCKVVNIVYIPLYTHFGKARVRLVSLHVYEVQLGHSHVSVHVEELVELAYIG